MMQPKPYNTELNKLPFNLTKCSLNQLMRSSFIQNLHVPRAGCRRKFWRNAIHFCVCSAMHVLYVLYCHTCVHAVCIHEYIRITLKIYKHR